MPKIILIEPFDLNFTVEQSAQIKLNKVSMVLSIYFLIFTHKDERFVIYGNSFQFQRILKITKILMNTKEDPEVGTFLEGGYSEESDTDSNILLEDNLLNSLDYWLERLFDGRTQKYYINYWPDFTTK